MATQPPQARYTYDDLLKTPAQVNVIFPPHPEER